MTALHFGVAAATVASSANLVLTIVLIKKLRDGKAQVEQEVATVRAATNRTLDKFKKAIEDIEV